MTVLHRSAGDNDGAYPNGGLAMDRTGVLYGTTSGGGKDGLGTVFKLTPTDHGWEESVIQTFRQLDGSNCFGGCLPMAGLTFGTGGTLYGTTGGGGKFGGGVGFSLTPSVSGEWSEQVLYHFKREVGDGQVPNSRLVVGESGALYGTTKSGGDKPDMNGFGTVFKLVPTPTGWREVLAWPDTPRATPRYDGVSQAIEVIDGETVRIEGRTYRLVGFNTPETGDLVRCDDERKRADAATHWLKALIATSDARLSRVACACKPALEGTKLCNYGRLCGVLTVAGRDAAQIVIKEGRAEPYVCSGTTCPRRRSWCG